MSHAIIFAVAIAALSLSHDARADESRLNIRLLIGSTRATDEGGALTLNRGTTYQATFAFDVWRGRAGEAVARTAVHCFHLAFTVLTPGDALPLEYASLYLTPAARVTFWPRAPVSVFGSIGAGYARYSESKLREDRGPNSGQRDTDAGGLGVRRRSGCPGHRLAGVSRRDSDHLPGARNFSVPTPGPRVHNVIASGGLVVRF